MKAFDFEYDGICLSDMGFIICKFGENGFDTVSSGSQITFNTVSILGGGKHELVSVSYSKCLETTFSICKNMCNGNGELEISVEEYRKMMRWLNRKTFHKFRLLDNEYFEYFFEGSFNINKIENDGKLIGLELTLVTNRPYALQEQRTIILKNIEFYGEKTIIDTSDEEGFIYPDLEITMESEGTLNITNLENNRLTEITNCKPGEVITLRYPVIESSLDTHDIKNCFNWIFPRISNTFQSAKNTFKISVPCTIKMTYFPIAKIGL